MDPVGERDRGHCREGLHQSEPLLSLLLCTQPAGWGTAAHLKFSDAHLTHTHHQMPEPMCEHGVCSLLGVAAVFTHPPTQGVKRYACAHTSGRGHRLWILSSSEAKLLQMTVIRDVTHLEAQGPETRGYLPHCLGAINISSWLQLLAEKERSEMISRGHWVSWHIGWPNNKKLKGASSAADVVS